MKVFTFLVFGVFVFVSSVAGEEFSISKLVSDFKQPAAINLFEGYEVSVSRFRVGDESNCRKFKWRQVSTQLWRLDADPSQTFCVNEDFAFHAISAGDSPAFVDMGYGQEKTASIRDSAVNEMYLAKAATTDNYPTLKVIISTETVVSCEEVNHERYGRVLNVLFEAPNGQSHGTVSLLADHNFLIEKLSLFMGGISAESTVDAKALSSRSDTGLAEGEKFCLNSYSIEYQDYEGRLFPSKCTTKDGLCWRVDDISTLGEVDSNIFTPESVGLNQPPKSKSTSNQYLWLSLGLVCGALGLVFLVHQIRKRSM